MPSVRGSRSLLQLITAGSLALCCTASPVDARDRAPLTRDVTTKRGAPSASRADGAALAQASIATAPAALGASSLVSTTSHDAALLAARAIARRVRTFPSLRSAIPLATWRIAPETRWRIRSSTRCLASASKLGVPIEPVLRPLATPVAAPVLLKGSVGGVTYRPVQRDREIELSCELAARLPALSAILRKHGVRVVHVNSSYRDQPRVSFHTFGLALDMAAFDTARGSLVVAHDFELTPDVATCEGRPNSERGRALLALACDLAQSGLFSSVLTPNYNEGHRDHFHLDVRPDDERLFVR